nr:MAG TPA: hypothetical protein [Caudoviricetes sp.]
MFIPYPSPHGRNFYTISPSDFFTGVKTFQRITSYLFLVAFTTYLCYPS